MLDGTLAWEMMALNGGLLHDLRIGLSSHVSCEFSMGKVVA